MQISLPYFFDFSIDSFIVLATSMPFRSCNEALTIMLFLFGNGFEPTDSKVFLPIMTVLPFVNALNFSSSSGICQGRELFLPMMCFCFVIAAIIIVIIMVWIILCYLNSALFWSL